MSLKVYAAAAYAVSTGLAVLCYLGTVRSDAIWLYLVPAAGISAVATLAPRKPTSYAGLVSGLTSGMIWAIIVNSLSGENLGPVARSTTACISGVTLLVFGFRRNEPNTSLVGLLIVTFGAMYYGAANEVWKLALSSMFFQLTGYVCSSHIAQKRAPQQRSSRQLLLLFVLLLTSIVAVLATPSKLPGLLNMANPRQSVVLSNADVEPPWISIKSSTTTLADNSPATKVINIRKAPEFDKRQVEWPLVALSIFLVLLFIVVAFALRMLYLHLKFIKITNRWRALDTRSSIAATWFWASRVLYTYGFVFSASTPLERIGKDSAIEKWPETMHQLLTHLASICGDSAFRREVPTLEAQTMAWNIAHSLKQEANRHSSLWRKMTFRFSRVLQ